MSLCGNAQDPGFPGPASITRANVDNPRTLIIGIVPRQLVADKQPNPNTLLIFTGTALVDVGLNETDNLNILDVTLNLGFKFDGNPLTFFRDAPVAALASPVFNPNDAGSWVTCAVNCVETELDQNMDLNIVFHCALTGASAGINRLSYQVSVLAYDNRFPTVY